MKVILWRADGAVRLDGGASLIDQWRADSTTLLWVDLSPEDGDEQARWLTEFGADATVRTQALV